jgi:hypothetical protein
MDDRPTRGSWGDGRVIDRTGKRYQIGHVSDAYGIWDTEGSVYPIVRFPLDAAGWQQAWAEFGRLEAPIEDPHPPRGPTLRNRLQRVPWSGVAVVVVFVGLFGALLVDGTIQIGSSHHRQTLIDEHFTEPQSGDSSEEVGRYVHGGYQVEVSAAHGTAGQEIVAYRVLGGTEEIAQVGAVRVEITVVSLTSPVGANATVGVGCLDAEGSTVSASDGYVFVVAEGSPPKFAIARAEGGAATLLVQAVQDKGVFEPDGSNRLSMECKGDLDGGATTLTFRVNGTRVLEFEDPDGLHQFGVISFTLTSDIPGTRMIVDDALLKED